MNSYVLYSGSWNPEKKGLVPRASGITLDEDACQDVPWALPDIRRPGNPVTGRRWVLRSVGFSKLPPRTRCAVWKILLRGGSHSGWFSMSDFFRTSTPELADGKGWGLGAVCGASPSPARSAVRSRNPVRPDSVRQYHYLAWQRTLTSKRVGVGCYRLRWLWSLGELFFGKAPTTESSQRPKRLVALPRRPLPTRLHQHYSLTTKIANLVYFR